MATNHREENLPLYFSRTETRQTHDIYLLGSIKSPNYYMEVFNLIENASPHDVINIFINSPGGSLWAAMEFISVIMRSECHIHASIEGEAHSAASLIFLACDTYSVPEFASMLCHYFSSGYSGKGGEISQWSQHLEKHYKNIFKDLYKNFLTEAELSEMVNGKDLWLTGNEIVKRLKVKVLAEEAETKSKSKKTKKSKKKK